VSRSGTQRNVVQRDSVGCGTIGCLRIGLVVADVGVGVNWLGSTNCCGTRDEVRAESQTELVNRC
jgi:hypothetical protein